ncbi:MAG: hypothetical protein LBC59_09000 [Chitinispirillales bacterium]|jgi:hypothetical protein|nr:hypothetical protein [Chitinispirillales bacterium]
MKKIASETQLYAQLAHRGDPSAFYALFSGQISDLYLLLRSQGKDHEAACGEAAQRLADLYGRVVRSRPLRPEKWFAARCGLKRFDAAAAGAAVSKTEIAAYEKLALRAVNAAYCKRLEHCDVGSGDVVEERSFARYLVGTVAAVIVIGFLFFAQSVLSVSFGRFGFEYKLSFPKIAEGLWDMSGLVRTDDDSWRREGAAPQPQQPPAQGAEATTRP